MTEKVRVALWMGPDLDYYHASRWLAGLHTLGRAGRICLQFSPPEPNHPLRTSDPLVAVFRVERGGESRLCVADFRDRSDEFSHPLLSECHAYFKRSVHLPDLQSLGEAARKVRPLGLNYACRTRGLAAKIGMTLLPALVKSPKEGSRWLAQQVRRLRAIPPSHLFERGPDAPAQKAVVFQTRVWGEGETGLESADSINGPRVALVRALRDAFGPRFRGGLVPTPLARDRYPDALARESWKKTKYIEMSGRQAVAVYTRGLHHSTAWKLPEYLAASQCIVAEPPRDLLPVPLIEGVNYLGFSRPDECIAACQSLLDDEARREGMREANHLYYRREVAPDSWAARRIEEAAEFLPAGSRR